MRKIISAISILALVVTIGTGPQLAFAQADEDNISAQPEEAASGEIAEPIQVQEQEAQANLGAGASANTVSSETTSTATSTMPATTTASTTENATGTGATTTGTTTTGTTTTGTTTATTTATSTGTTTATSATGTVSIMVMKHFCPTITNLTDFNNLGGFGAQEAKCLTVVKTGDTPSTDTVNGGQMNFTFLVQGRNGQNQLVNFTAPRLVRDKVPETLLGSDANGDGVVSSSTLYDASSYAFDGILRGPVTVTETTPAPNTHFGTILFTPPSIIPNSDALTFRSQNPSTGTIYLDTTGATSTSIMLHVFDFANSTSSASTTATTTTGTTTGTTGTSTATTTGATTTPSTTASGTVAIMVMKHICPATVKNNTDFTNLGGFLNKVATCPTVVQPTDTPSLAAIAGPRTPFTFLVQGRNAQNQLVNFASSSTRFVRQKLCESTVGQDINGDGQVSSSTCLDTSNYSFDNVPRGPVSVTEVNPPSGTHFGALEFTPVALAVNNDAATLVSNHGDGVIDLNTAAASGTGVMLHVFDFQNVSATGTGTTTTGTTTTGTTTTGTTTIPTTGTTTPSSLDSQLTRLQTLLDRLDSLITRLSNELDNVLSNGNNGNNNGNNSNSRSDHSSSSNRSNGNNNH